MVWSSVASAPPPCCSAASTSASETPMRSVAAVREMRSCSTVRVTRSRAISGGPTPLAASWATVSVLPSATSSRDCTWSIGTDVEPMMTADPTWLGAPAQPLTTAPTVAITRAARTTCLYTTHTLSQAPDARAGVPRSGAGSVNRPVFTRRERTVTRTTVGTRPGAVGPPPRRRVPSRAHRSPAQHREASASREEGAGRHGRPGTAGRAAARATACAAARAAARADWNSEVRQVDQPVLQGPGHQRGLRGRRPADLRVPDPHPVDVGLDRLDREAEPRGDEVLRVALEPRQQHLPLAVAERGTVRPPVADHRPAQRRGDVGQVAG